VIGSVRATLALPTLARLPIGGFKVHYEYANRLARRGHEVSIVHAEPPARRRPVRERMHEARRRGLRRRRDRGRIVPWFEFDPDVHVSVVPTLDPEHLPDADVTIATAWQTAEALAETPARLGARAFVVYDYEHWMTADAPTRRRISATLTGDWSIAATSPSVTELLRDHGVDPAAYVPCGIDLGVFGLDVPIADRSGRTVGFPDRHLEPSKGTQDAIAALDAVRSRPGADALDVSAYSRYPSEEPLDWVRFVLGPSDAELRAFYNRVAVFVLPSHFEGWGLPGVEALACGAALVTADCVGNRDYAIDEETALVVPRGRPDLLAGAVARLVEDEPLRRDLAARGHEFVQRFSWEDATDALERLLVESAERAARTA
jgi:glycosyltransferase involved in cell wall biosynthesis